MAIFIFNNLETFKLFLQVKEIKTRCANQNPPFGFFDDFICVETSENQERFLMRPEEFEFLAAQLFSDWETKKSAYTQIFKEWNECIGFNGEEEKPSLISDVKNTVEALKLLKGKSSNKYGDMSSEDLDAFIHFLQRNVSSQVFIFKS